MPMKTSDRAYLAGILDGEGHFSIVHIPNIRRYRPFLGLMTTSVPLVNWITTNIGGYVYDRSHQPSHKKHWKDRYEWRLESSAIEHVTNLVLPYLVIKKSHAEIMLSFRKTFSGPGKRPSEETTQLRNSLFLQMKKLNSRTFAADCLS